MLQRPLVFERLDARQLCAVVGLGAEGNASSDRVSVPVTIDNATGVRAAEVRLQYDAEEWNVVPTAIKAGSAWVRGGSAMTKVDPQAGEIRIFVFATEELAGAPGTLVDLEFTRQESTAETYPAVELKSVRLNEGSIVAELRDDRETADGDYINPAVRAKLSKVSDSELAPPPVPLDTPDVPSTTPGDRLFPRLSRDRSTPMGPLRLTTPSPILESRNNPAPTAVVPLVPSSPSIPWMLLLADEDLRARRRAA